MLLFYPLLRNNMFNKRDIFAKTCHFFVIFHKKWTKREKIE